MYNPSDYIGKRIKLCGNYATYTSELGTVIECSQERCWSVRMDNGICYSPYSPFAPRPECELIEEDTETQESISLISVVPLTRENGKIGDKVKLIPNYVNDNSCNIDYISTHFPDYRTRIFTIGSIGSIDCRFQEVIDMQDIHTNTGDGIYIGLHSVLLVQNPETITQPNRQQQQIGPNSWVTVIDTPILRYWLNGERAIGWTVQLSPHEYNNLIASPTSETSLGDNRYGINFILETLRLATPNEIIAAGGNPETQTIIQPSPTKQATSKIVEPIKKETTLDDMLAHIIGYKKEVLDCILNTPHKIPILKSSATNRKYFDKIINSLIPYKMGIEIECQDSLTKGLKYYDDSQAVIKNNHLGNCVAFNDDYTSSSTNEHRLCFNGYKQIMSLNKLCSLLATHCTLNLNAGIHYHFDMPELKGWDDRKSKWNIEKKSRFIFVCESKLDKINSILKYTGTYNKRKIGQESKGTWLNIRYSTFNTIEIRTASAKFDYKIIVKEIILLSEIITKIRKEMQMPLYKL